MTDRAATFLAALALLAGCARVVAPAGGPPDTLPPSLVGSFPDSGAVHVPRGGPFRLAFSEWVDPATVKSAVSLAPSGTRSPDIRVDGPDVVVTPREPLDSPATYVLRIQPGLADWHKASTRSLIEVPFATGDRIDSGRVLARLWIGSDTAPPVPVRGRLGAWPLDPTVRKGLARQLRRKDSTAWLSLPPQAERERPWRWTWADSSGRADLRFLPSGDWFAAAWNDLDKDNFWRPGDEQPGWIGRISGRTNAWTDSFLVRLELDDSGSSRADTSRDPARDSLRARDSLALDSLAARWDRLPDDSTGLAWLGTDSLPRGWRTESVRIRLWPLSRKARPRLSHPGSAALRLAPGKWAGEAWMGPAGATRPGRASRDGSRTADPWCPVVPFEIDRGDSLRVRLDCSIGRAAPDTGKAPR